MDVILSSRTKGFMPKRCGKYCSDTNISRTTLVHLGDLVNNAETLIKAQIGVRIA
jgi:hypothetical protein